AERKQGRVLVGRDGFWIGKSGGGVHGCLAGWGAGSGDVETPHRRYHRSKHFCDKRKGSGRLIRAHSRHVRACRGCRFFDMRALMRKKDEDGRVIWREDALRTSVGHDDRLWCL